MCFSATISFGAGIALAAMGIAATGKSQQPSQKYFASIPFLFSIQQFAEGVVWLALQNPSFNSLEQTATYLFLFFAQVLWPVWLPYSVLMLETDPKMKKVLFIPLIAGFMVSLYLGFCLLLYNTDAKIVGSHIYYQLEYPVVFAGYGEYLYIFATVFPPFLSSIKKMWILGGIIITSYLITRLFYAQNVISIWCFFASAISLIVIYVINQLNSGLLRTKFKIR